VGMGLMFTVQLQAFNRLQTAGQAFFYCRYFFLSYFPGRPACFADKKSSKVKDRRTMWKLK